MQQRFLTLVVLFVTAIGFCQRSVISAASIDASAGYIGDGGGFTASCNYHLDKWTYFEIGIFGSSDEVRSNAGVKVPYNLYAFQLGYFQQIWEQYSFKRYAFYAGGGITVGHEILNNGDDTVLNGVNINGVSQSVYGSYLSAVGEMRFGENFLLLLKGYGYYHVNSDVGDFYTYGGVGVRYFLF